MGEEFDESDMAIYEGSLIRVIRAPYFGRVGVFGDELTYPITADMEESSFNGIDHKKPQFQSRIEIPGFIDFYSDVIDAFCEDGEDEGLAAIANLDVDVMQGIHRRLQFGRYIIDSKLAENPDFRELLEGYTPDIRQDVLKFIVIPNQEARVIEKTIDFSETNNLDLNPQEIPWLISEYIRMNTLVQFEFINKVYGVDLSK